ncbi:hypothetical protein [Streptomyces alanosinicus]|uniref:hypothetical protein n=1 Tax=Streptomyces alanosinicus TaxID=68171 RepID=UPI001679F36B|nr:hypothetical protein [Streptomyces alanosinicus]
MISTPASFGKNSFIVSMILAWSNGTTGTGSGVISLEDFLAAAGLVLAPGASVS